MSLLERVKKYFLRQNKTEVEYQKPPMGYGEAKILLDNLGGLKYCKEQREKGLSQKEVAKELNITQPILSQYCINEGCKWTNLNKLVQTKPSPIKKHKVPQKQVKPIKCTKKNRIQVLEKLGGYDYIKQQKEELGKTYSQISVELGQDSDDSWISNYMRYRGYKTKTLKFEKEVSIIEQNGGLLFLKTELQNKSVSNIAQELNIREKSIYTYIYKKGYNMREFRKKGEKLSVPDEAANWKLYKEWDDLYTKDQFQKAIALKGLKETADALNCTEYTLKLYCNIKEIIL